MRTGHSIIAGVITLATLSLATPAAAQHAQVREGFWAGVGAGWGSMGLNCDGCDGVDRTGSYTGYFALGGTLRPSLLLGAEFNGWDQERGWCDGPVGQRVGRGLLVPEGAVRSVPQGRCGLLEAVGR